MHTTATQSYWFHSSEMGSDSQASTIYTADTSANPADTSVNPADTSANHADTSANHADTSANHADTSANPTSISSAASTLPIAGIRALDILRVSHTYIFIL